jgi:hypothetical protein
MVDQYETLRKEVQSLTSTTYNIDKNLALLTKEMALYFEMAKRQERILFRTNGKKGLIDRLEEIECRDRETREKQKEQEKELQARRKELRASIYAFGGSAILLIVQVVLRIYQVIP